MILQGDCLDSMKTLPDNSVDSIVSDPPYGLSFMGKKWDYQVPSKEIWAEALRVLKPGGHLLAFGGTRTYHRLVVNIEDAGFEIRDQVMWIYGSGFPKSMDISKQIDKQAGAKREVIGTVKQHDIRNNSLIVKQGSVELEITAPSTDLAKQYQGWGTALKPANEPICVARKPIEKGLTVAQNVIKWGTGGLNIDESRIGSETITSNAYKSKGKEGCLSLPGEASQAGNEYLTTTHQGRWPANVLFDEAAAAELDLQSGILKQGVAGNKSRPFGDGEKYGTCKEFKPNNSQTYACDKPSGASRFFYVAKASKRERNQGLEGMPEITSTSKQQNPKGRMQNGEVTNIRPEEPKNQNFHPTVKPIKLMEYLIKLVTPVGGTVLDPFMGSGSTGVAAKRLGFNFIGCELNPEYAAIAEKRIEAAGNG